MSRLYFLFNACHFVYPLPDFGLKREGKKIIAGAYWASARHFRTRAHLNNNNNNNNIKSLIVCSFLSFLSVGEDDDKTNDTDKTGKNKNK